MSDIEGLFVAAAALWLAVVGLLLVCNQRQYAAAVARWPFVTSFGLLRRTAGGLLVALGNQIRGGHNRERRR